MFKRIMTIVLVVVLLATVAVAAIPSWRNTVASWFTSEEKVEGSTDSTNPTEGTEATEPTEGEDATTPTNPEDEILTDEVKVPFTFAEFFGLATTDGAWNVAPEKAEIYDLTADEFVVESDEEKAEYVAIMLRVNPYGAMSIVQEGFENLENHPGEVVAPIFELCDCKVGHKGSWNPDMGQFHWHVAENNEALGAKSWTRMTGEMQEVLVDFETRETIRATACYWYVENTEGVKEVRYGVRVCGDQKDPEPPVVEPEKETYTVSFNFVAANGQNLPNGVLSQKPASVKVTEGETYKVNFTFKSVETEAGTWTFKSWDKTSVKVTGDVTITGTWTFSEKPGEGDGPEKETYKVTFKFTATNGTLPSAVTSLKPADKTVEEGTKINAPSIQNTVKVNGGTWTFNGWDKTTVTVTSNVTITGSWTFKADEQPPVVKEYTVSYNFVGTKGETLPQEVMNFKPASVVVKEGTIVTPRNLSGVEVEVSNGTWKFQGWDKSSANVSSDTTFVGSWKFVEKLSLEEPIKDYLINFNFVGTNGTLPSSVKSLKPGTIVAKEGEVINAPSIQPIVEVNGGAWVFNGWSSNRITVVGDATITGTWTFEKDPEPEHSQPEGDEDPNPVADNQDELDELGDRTDEVPEEDNTPVHSDRENLSLMPVGEEGEDEDHDADDGINNQHSAVVDDVARNEVDTQEDEKPADNGLSLMPVEGESDSAEGGESDDLTLSLDLPVDDSEVADQDTQDELNAMFPGRE